MIGTAYIYAFSGGAANGGAAHVLHTISRQEHHTQQQMHSSDSAAAYLGFTHPLNPLKYSGL